MNTIDFLIKHGDNPEVKQTFKCFLFETAKTYETVYAQSLLDVEITLDISDLMEYKKKTMSKTIVPNTQYDPNGDYHMIESKCKRCNNF